MMREDKKCPDRCGITDRGGIGIAYENTISIARDPPFDKG